MPRLVSIDRETPLLLPPSIQEWVAEDDIARFILDCVEAVEESALLYNHRNSGSRQYPPRMMLALLIYCYSHGVTSSRKIEKLTYRDVSVRFITGNHHPDHDTICPFRRNNGDLFRHTFTTVLGLAASMKIANVGEVAIDGSMIFADASRDKTLSRKQLEEGIAEFEEIVADLEAEAEKTDQREEAEDDGEPPEALRNARARRDELRRSLELLNNQTEERHEKRKSEQEKFERRCQEDPDTPGTKPTSLPAEPKQEDTINQTDPEARLMKPKRGGGRSMPGYNAQLAVNADVSCPLIVAASVVDEAGDKRQLEPMARAAKGNCPTLQRVHVDTGYDTTAQVFEVETGLGVHVQGPVSKPARSGGSSRKSAQREKTSRYRKAMSASMRGESGRRSYRLRKTTVEPVFGLIKRGLGFRRFTLRGLGKVNIEWTLVALAHNLRLLHGKAMV